MAALFRLVACGVLVLGTACKGDAKDPPKGAAPNPAPDTCASAKLEGGLAWISDDYPGAVACAKQQHVPLVLDLWAPWCHTCLSMQTTVFLDPSFGADNTRFVFAKLDTDREQNAGPMEKLAIAAWPTFYVVDSTSEAVLSRFVGGATVAQFHEFLEAGLRATKGGADAASTHMLGAQRALAMKDYPTADAELTAGLAAAPATWPSRPELLVELIMTKAKAKDTAGCMDLADKHLDELGNAAATSDFLVTAMSCTDDSKDPAAAKALRERAVKRWQRLLDESKELSIDDRSDAMASERETLDKLGDKAGANQLALAQRTLLDDAATKAPNPLAAMTYNWPRTEVYVYLGVPLELVPALEKSAKDLPTEYDPRARLGYLYFQAKKYDEAATWTDAALALVYGPRKGRVLMLRAEIAGALHDVAGQKQFLDHAVALYAALPKGQEAPEAFARATDALAKLGAGSAK
ncbi:MAG: thioredoxin family protein [Kofleriaceae bacterium]